MRITVILCTYNRCRSLQKALSSAAALVLPESVEWEILVVDNNSNDQTRETVKDSIRRLPGLVIRIVVDNQNFRPGRRRIESFTVIRAASAIFLSRSLVN